METIDYSDGGCHFCRKWHDWMYHCSICKFSIDVKCWKDPPPFTIYQPKSHDHRFTLMARMVTFICNACGIVGDRNSYFCFECGFMLHKDCIALPRVININRHEHRVSRTYNLYHGDWECGVCREKMDWSFGAFSCTRCRPSNYAVHPKCATRKDVWDGKELEDEPEEEEDEAPYKIINENEIVHFSHDEHNLRRGDDNVANYKEVFCDACILPISSDPFFKCVQCEFFLHKVCANFPRRKRNILHQHKLTIAVDYKAGKHFKCTYCYQFFDGFMYNCRCDSDQIEVQSDVWCGSISEPFHHELHPHPLYRTLTGPMTCGACREYSFYVLSCTVCGFVLCMRCATLPRKVKHRCDDHFLSLNHDAGNSKGQLWCDICEGKTDPSVWFYGCDECGLTLHIKCVLGDMYFLKPGNEYKYAKLVPSNGMSRPFCFVCENRCMFPSFLKSTATSDSAVVYACSVECANRRQWRKVVSRSV